MEEFKAIENYDYSISNHGNVKNDITGKILKPGLNRVTGYYQVVLNKNSQRRTFRVDRLVADAFIPNIENLTEVEHLDNWRTNNNVNNLQFCYIRKK